MTRINLLPWRAQRRLRLARRKKIFIACGLGLLIFFIMIEFDLSQKRQHMIEITRNLSAPLKLEKTRLSHATLILSAKTHALTPIKKIDRYSIRVMQFAGWLYQAGHYSAMLRLPDGSSFRVIVGECIGTEHACIEKIDTHGIRFNYEAKENDI